MAVAKPPSARLPCISLPTARCSPSESPQDRSHPATRSRDGGVLSMPNFSCSPPALSDALTARRYSDRDSSTSVAM